MLEYYEVKTHEDIENLFKVVEVIWKEVFTPIIGSDQVSYMMVNYQSVKCIEKEINEGAHYLMLMYEGKCVGYTAYEESYEQVYISKLYLDSNYRGLGLSSEVFRFYDNLGKGKVLHLNVNQGNALAIAVYEHKGFKRVDERYVDIGEGYIMNDYIYEKDLKNIDKA